MSSKPIIYVVEEHHELFYLWRELEFKNNRILHLDAHCDMHNLLIDRKSNFCSLLPGLKKIDCGNFISFAVRDGMINDIKWIYDKYGGRFNDTTHVKYTTDFTSIPYLIKNFFISPKKYPLKYTEHLFDDVNCFEIEEDVYLDIDWDFFALESKSLPEIQKNINLFLEYNFKIIPDYTCVSYSSDYVLPSRREFDDFVLRLKDKFKADIIKYSYPLPKEEEKQVNIFIRYKKGLKRRFKRYVRIPFKRLLNRVGIY